MLRYRYCHNYPEYQYFGSETIIDATEAFSRNLEEAKENITSKFYEDYIHYVFGYNIKTRTHEKCLLNTLRAPQYAHDNAKRLFVITLMSRLIFVRFLEDKKNLVKPGSCVTPVKRYELTAVNTMFH